MNNQEKTLAQLKKASKLSRLAFRKYGPKSYKRGMGSLLKYLSEHDGATQSDLTVALGCDRGALKDVVLKAKRFGYVTMEKSEEAHTYVVSLTDEGKEVAEKRNEANAEAAEKILEGLTADEQAELDRLTEKLILSLKEQGIDGKKKGHKAHRKGSCKGHHHHHRRH
jgi:DNA-binding MarR family transcriptional regulator